MAKSESKFQDLYKSKNKCDLQKARRETLLKEQKLQRSLLQDESRTLETSFPRPSRNFVKIRHKTLKTKLNLNYKLQLSEWLNEKPEDLNDWILVPCPVGRRCMVVANNGYTEMYNKSGRLFETFNSLLPGNVGCKNDVTILDCVFVDMTSTFYVLDGLSYAKQNLINCEAQFRFFWLSSKFSEGNFQEIGPRNRYSFVCLESYDFENTTRVSIGLQRYPLWRDNCPRLDGFLFYHKEASYTFGTTPLVGWLFAFMVPEVLDYAVNPTYMAQKPDDYTDYIRYIIDFDEKMAKRKYRPPINRGWRRMTMDEDFSRRNEGKNDHLKGWRRTTTDEDVSKKDEGKNDHFKGWRRMTMDEGVSKKNDKDEDEDENDHLKELLKAEMDLELEDESGDTEEA